MNSFESFLLESTSEIDFIRIFFSGFVNFDDYDRHTLLVFADWLDDRADPRGKLVRMAGEAADLFNAAMRVHLSLELGISNHIAMTLDRSDDHEPRVDFYVRTGNVDALLQMDENGTRWVQVGMPISVNRVSADNLEKFFWGLVGWGWGVGSMDHGWPLDVY